MRKKTHYTCAVIGDWHLAFVTAVGLSSLNHKTVLLKTGQKVNSWTSCPKLDLAEPEVNEAIDRLHKEGIFCYSHYQDDDWSADFVWLAVDTVVKEDDTSDLSSIEEILKYDFSSRIKKGLVVTSQVPLGFCQRYKNKFNISYIPENLRLGQGLETFLKCDRLVIGSDSTETLYDLKALLNEVDGEVILCDLNTSEMIKHATNAFLASSISLANQLAMIGEPYGVDNNLVGRSLRLDSRIGKKAYVIPGTGFAGGTLPRDLKSLQSLGANKGVSTELIDAILTINESALTSVVTCLSQHFISLENKKCLILGYSYKEDIDTLRRSPAIELAKLLKEKKVQIYGHDPRMNDKDLGELEGLINHIDELSNLDSDLDACIIVTAREEFHTLDWRIIRGNSDKQILLFDLDGNICEKALLKNGYTYKTLWQPKKSLGMRDEDT